jgi:hypothetical protein
MEIKGKTENYYLNNLRQVKGIWNYTPTPSKDQTWE